MRRRNNGFTLLELLIAISIFAIVVVGLYVAFSSGLLAHSLGEKNFAVYQNARLVLNKIALDFQNALYSSTLGLGGKASEVYFYVLPESFDPRESPAFRRITYYTKKEATILSLLREEVPSANAKFDKEDKKGRKGQELATRLKKVSFAYFRESPESEEGSFLDSLSSAGKKREWVEEWHRKDGFPLGIKVILEYPEAKFSRLLPSPLRFHKKEEAEEIGGIEDEGEERALEELISR